MRCFLNLAGAVYDPDDLGLEVDTIQEVRVAAARHIAEIIRDMPGLLWASEAIRLEVIDQNRRVLLTIVTSAIDGPAITG